MTMLAVHQDLDTAYLRRRAEEEGLTGALREAEGEARALRGQVGPPS